jgi:hypothetical protein
MAVILNASTSSGFVQSADTSGIVQVQNNGTTRLEANGTGVVVTGTGSVSGDLSFNSGYGSSAVAYGCRAWVNFDGLSSPAGDIRGSGNITSIDDNGTGDYTINFTNAMPDTNYALSGSGSSSGGSMISFLAATAGSAATLKSTTQARIRCSGTGGSSDNSQVSAMFFR